MANFPKGPFIVYDDDRSNHFYITSDERLKGDKIAFAKVPIGYNEPFESEQRAAAQLFAAAPELVEALLMAREWIYEARDRAGLPVSQTLAQIGAALSKAGAEEGAL